MQGFGGRLLIMLSNGGVVSADVAARNPIRMVESGPAAGALAGAWHAQRLGLDRLLCFDMGGTTAKSCLIEGTEPELTTDFEIARMYRFKKGSGFPVTMPSVDLVEIGAGGGSIARVDDLGLLKVGPDSAGAEPGPACYGRGGTQPSVTDGDLLLGYLDPGFFLGGEMPLDVEAATQSVAKIASVLGTSTPDTAGGVYELVNQNMAASARMHAVERGVDLRGTPLIAFGGAGPVHACGVAELLEAPQVVFPANASVLSAFGALVTPVRIDLAAQLRAQARRRSRPRNAKRSSTRCAPRADAVLSSAGVPAGDVVFRYAIDARYSGQGNEITIPLGEGETWPVDAADDRRALRQAVRDRLRDDHPRRCDRGGDVAHLRGRARAEGHARGPPRIRRGARAQGHTGCALRPQQRSGRHAGLRPHRARHRCARRRPRAARRARDDRGAPRRLDRHRQHRRLRHRRAHDTEREEVTARAPPADVHRAPATSFGQVPHLRGAETVRTDGCNRPAVEKLERGDDQ